jgi:broad specificity phosphatase PhoE
VPVVYLIRHGQASFGAADYDVLSPVGHQQAELAGAALVRRGVRPTRVLAGSLLRQRDTATSCVAAARFSLPVEIDPRFDEYSLRILDGGTGASLGSLGSSRSVQPLLDAALLDWLRPASIEPGVGAELGSKRAGGAELGTTTAPVPAPEFGGLSWPEFRDGAVAAQRDLMASLPSGGSALAFTSGGVVAAICADLLGLGAEGFVALNRVVVNTGITKIVSGRSGTSLLSFNDHAHLEGAADLLTYR